MAKTRYTGKGTLVKSNTNGDGNTFLTVGLARQVTPPPRQKARIDVTGMEDTNTETRTGIEQLSEFQFTSLWDDNEATDAAVATLYGSGDEVAWQWISTDGTTTWTQQFDGIVSDLVPQSFSGTDPITWQVTILRTSAITDTFS